MTGPLPFGFFACLGLAALGGGLVLWLLHRLFRKAPVLTRLRRLPASQRASTIVEFPFVLLLVVQMTLLTWQLGLMSSAYLVMDYAAFAAVRSAVVIVPEERDTPVAEEGNKLNSSDYSAWDVIVSQAPNVGDRLKSGKGQEIRQAAVFACYPISGVFRAKNFDIQSIQNQLGNIVPDFGGLGDTVKKVVGAGGEFALSGLSKANEAVPGADYLNRFGYAWMNTRVRVQPEAARTASSVSDMFPDDARFQEAKTYLEGIVPEDYTSWYETQLFETTNLEIDGGDTVTVEVNHDFQLAIPYAGALLSGWRSKQGIGWYTTLTTRATMLSEGYDEEEPKSGN